MPVCWERGEGRLTWFLSPRNWQHWTCKRCTADQFACNVPSITSHALETSQAQVQGSHSRYTSQGQAQATQAPHPASNPALLHCKAKDIAVSASLLLPPSSPQGDQGGTDRLSLLFLAILCSRWEKKHQCSFFEGKANSTWNGWELIDTHRKKDSKVHLHRPKYTTMTMEWQRCYTQKMVPSKTLTSIGSSDNTNILLHRVIRHFLDMQTWLQTHMESEVK